MLFPYEAGPVYTGVECSTFPVSVSHIKVKRYFLNHYILNLPILTIASGNQRKVSEISKMLDVLSLQVNKQPDFLNVEETGSSYFDNALLKAKAASLATKTWALADDSGLEVDFLDGRPGIYSARYAKNSIEKIKKLMNELGDTPYRSAKFISCIVLCDPRGNLVKDSTGICWGEILREPKYPRGEFESIFWVKEANCVYGELNQSQLSKHGSRGKAARNIAPYLKKEIGL